jgi:hypothetical protein
MRRVAVPEISLLFEVVADLDESEHTAATFKKLTTDAGWDSKSRLSVEARERVVLSLLCDGALCLAKHPSGWGVAIRVVPGNVRVRRRRLGESWCHFNFLCSELD